MSIVCSTLKGVEYLMTND